MIFPSDWKVLVPGLCLVHIGKVQGSLDHNFVVEPGAGDILQQRLLLHLQQPTRLLSFIVHLQQGVELTPVKVKVLDKVVKIWGLVLHGLPNNLREEKTLYSVLYILYF